MLGGRSVGVVWLASVCGLASVGGLGCATDVDDFAAGGLAPDDGTESTTTFGDVVTATEGQVSAAATTAGSSGTTAEVTSDGSSTGSPPDEGSTGDPEPEPPSPAACAEGEPVEGLARVLVCIPEGMEGKTATPAALVVALHGSSQTADEFRETTGWDRLAGQYGFYVVFPQAPDDPLSASGGPAAWRWWREFTDWTRASFNPHFAPLIEVVDGMKARHEIDPQRVFVTGVSAGGYMTTLMLAAYPDVFTAGAAFSGGPHNCDLRCTDSNKVQDWTRPIGYQPPDQTDIWNALPQWWEDPNSAKPRLMVVHGQLDDTVRPINLDDAVRQWTAALQIDDVPDNAALGEPPTLGTATYRAYARGTEVAVASVLVPELGHGTPVKPGSAPGEGGFDPIPSTVAADCSPALDAGCEQDWTNTGSVYGPWEAAKFFGLVGP